MKPRVVHITTLIIGAAFVFIAWKLGRFIASSQDFKYDIKVSNGKYMEHYYTNEIHKDSSGCLKFLNKDNKEQTVCGSYQVIQNN